LTWICAGISPWVTCTYGSRSLQVRSQSCDAGTWARHWSTPPGSYKCVYYGPYNVIKYQYRPKPTTTCNIWLRLSADASTCTFKAVTWICAGLFPQVFPRVYLQVPTGCPDSCYALGGNMLKKRVCKESIRIEGNGTWMAGCSPSRGSLQGNQ
jgi:hypothetical protein